MNKYIVMAVVLVIMVLALVVCYAALVAHANADDIEEAYWRDKALKDAREEKRK